MKTDIKIIKKLYEDAGLDLKTEIMNFNMALQIIEATHSKEYLDNLGDKEFDALLSQTLHTPNNKKRLH